MAGLIKGLPASPADRIAVADNLFGAGETALAAEIYEYVDRAALAPTENDWVEFQLAGCARRQRNYGEARKRYRRLLGGRTEAWLVELCKWWLDALDEREQLAQDGARLQAAIQQGEAARDARQNSAP